MIPTLIGITMITYGVLGSPPVTLSRARWAPRAWSKAARASEAINQMRVLYGLAYVRPVKMASQATIR